MEYAVVKFLVQPPEVVLASVNVVPGTSSNMYVASVSSLRREQPGSPPYNPKTKTDFAKKERYRYVYVDGQVTRSLKCFIVALASDPLGAIANYSESRSRVPKPFRDECSVGAVTGDEIQKSKSKPSSTKALQNKNRRIGVNQSLEKLIAGHTSNLPKVNDPLQVSTKGSISPGRKRSHSLVLQGSADKSPPAKRSNSEERPRTPVETTPPPHRIPLEMSWPSEWTPALQSIFDGIVSGLQSNQEKFLKKVAQEREEERKAWLEREQYLTSIIEKGAGGGWFGSSPLPKPRWQKQIQPLRRPLQSSSSSSRSASPSDADSGLPSSEEVSSYPSLEECDPGERPGDHRVAIGQVGLVGSRKLYLYCNELSLEKAMTTAKTTKEWASIMLTGIYGDEAGLYRFGTPRSHKEVTRQIPESHFTVMKVKFKEFVLNRLEIPEGSFSYLQKLAELGKNLGDAGYSKFVSPVTGNGSKGKNLKPKGNAGGDQGKNRKPEDKAGGDQGKGKEPKGADADGDHGGAGKGSMTEAVTGRVSQLRISRVKTRGGRTGTSGQQRIPDLSRSLRLEEMHALGYDNTQHSQEDQEELSVAGHEEETFSQDQGPLLVTVPDSEDTQNISISSDWFSPGYVNGVHSSEDLFETQIIVQETQIDEYDDYAPGSDTDNTEYRPSDGEEAQLTDDE